MQPAGRAAADCDHVSQALITFAALARKDLDSSVQILGVRDHE
jgi:hypothetical protein